MRVFPPPSAVISKVSKAVFSPLKLNIFVLPRKSLIRQPKVVGFAAAFLTCWLIKTSILLDVLEGVMLADNDVSVNVDVLIVVVVLVVD